VYHDPTLMKSDKRRDRIKTFTYSSIYGAGIPKMALSAGITTAEMREVRDSIAARYPGFFQLALEARHQLNQNGGYVETLYGRKLPVEKEHAASNYILQGTAADCLKRSLVFMAQAGLEEYMLVPVHDEVVLNVPKDIVDDVRAEVKANMECFDFTVPLTADPSGGCVNWADAK
jgi:DNA polymerase-1